MLSIKNFQKEKDEKNLINCDNLEVWDNMKVNEIFTTVRKINKNLSKFFKSALTFSFLMNEVDALHA